MKGMTFQEWSVGTSAEARRIEEDFLSKLEHLRELSGTQYYQISLTHSAVSKEAIIASTEKGLGVAPLNYDSLAELLVQPEDLSALVIVVHFHWTGQEQLLENDQYVLETFREVLQTPISFWSWGCRVVLWFNIGSDERGIE